MQKKAKTLLFYKLSKTPNLLIQQNASLKHRYYFHFHRRFAARQPQGREGPG
jgi:hypothetical protein